MHRHRNIAYGWVDVITSGTMYAGKTTELIRRVRNFVLGKRTVAVFQPGMAKRYSDEEVVVTHDGISIKAQFCATPAEILAEVAVTRPNVVAIDEAQFYPAEIVDVVQQLANEGHYVIVAGLAQTSEGKPFGSMPNLMAVADEVISVHGVCVVCGEPATKPFAIYPKTEDVAVGAVERYEARCRSCWLEGRRARGEVTDCAIF